MVNQSPPEFEGQARPMGTADLANAGEPPRRDAENMTLAPDEPTSLLPDDEVGDLRRRWDEIQTGFVDEPRRSVEDADALVATTMKRLAEMFASERAELERQWDQGDDVSTEDLRLVLQRYRSFFGRLLTV
jgi:hypothetical protein